MFFALKSLTTAFNGALATGTSMAVTGMAARTLLSAGAKNPKRPPSLFERMFRVLRAC